LPTIFVVLINLPYNQKIYLCKNLFKMNWRKLSVVSVMLVVSLMVYNHCYSQESSLIFVVYGYVIDLSELPIDDNYEVIVTNFTKGISVYGEIGTGVDLGKFCVVFIDYSGNKVVTEGDIIRINAREKGSTEETKHGEYVISASDGMSGGLFVENIVKTYRLSWGAVKSLYPKD